VAGAGADALGVGLGAFGLPVPLRTLEDIRADLLQLQQEGEGLLEQIIF
jgi:hypothetical protein